MNSSRQTRPDSSAKSQELVARRGGHGRRDSASVDRRGRGNHRFFFTYLVRELQRRRRQALLMAVGLAVGGGLVLTVTAVSSGVRDAQTAVLHSLYGVGTDVTVSKAAGPFNPGAPRTSGASRRFGFTPGNTVQHEDQLTETDGLGVIPASSVASIARLPGVKAVAGGLSLIDSKLTVPSKSQLGPNGAPPASATRATTFTVEGVDLSDLGLGPFASTRVIAGRSFQDSDASANVGLVDASYAAAHKLSVGSTVTVAHVPFKVIGIVDQPQSAGATDVYISLERAEALAATPEVPSSVGKVDTIYVVAASGIDVSVVQKQIAKLLPGATVTTASSLAGEVTGSLASASSLISDLGRWLAGAVLVVAFVMASVLSAAAVSRRVREIGTLKALGWGTRRIVAQIMGESAVIGLTGAAMGVAIGFAGAALVKALAPGLAATVSDKPGSPPAQNVSFNASGAHHSIAQGAQHTVPVHLSAPVTFEAIGLAVLLALLGAVIAGSLGAWRAARLPPVQALARVA